MDTQTVHPSFDAHDHKVASSHVEEEGDHHEKKSVFKRVKAKAKQLRDTITNYGHGHPEPDHDHVVHNPDDHDLDEEEDDEDDEMVEDPKVHGAPKYDSAVVNSAIPGHQKNSESVGDSTCMPQDDHKSRTDKAAVELNDPIRGYDTRQSVATFGEGHKEPINIPLSFSPGHRENLENDPRRTVVPGSGESEPRVNLQRPMGLEEDPASPKGAHHPRTPPNYQTKVTDPTGSGAEEVGVNQILGSFDKMNIYDQSEPSKQTSPQNLSHGISTGAHDQFSPKTLPKKNIYDQSEPSKQNSPQNLSHDISTGSHDKLSPETLPKMNIYDQSEPSKQKSSQNLSHDISTGTHDQFSPETFPKMNIYDQLEPSKQISKSSQNLSHGISTGTHDQFSQETLPKMNIYDQSEPSKQKSSPNLSHDISTGTHDQFSQETLPKMNIYDQSEPSKQKSSQNLSHDISTGTHDISTGTHDISTGTHDISTGTHDISTGTHDQFSPETFPKMNVYDQLEPSKQKSKSSQNLSHGISTGTHDQFSQETLPKMNIYDQSEPSKQKSSQNLSHDISTGAHDQFSPETFPKMNIYDQLEPSKQKSPQNLSTGAHDQFSHETFPREHLNNSGTTQNPEAIPGNLESIKPKSYPQDNPVEKSANTTTYTHKISSPASAISNKAISAGNVDTSNLSYGEKDNRTRERHQTMQENQQTINPESNPHENEAERSSYTDKIASAASAIADTAISTKNIVVSKLGYGEKDNTTGHEVHRNENSTDSTSTAKSAASSTADYGEKIAATITEKPSLVDEKVAGAGGDVMSKMQGTGNNESDKEGKVGQDKGVSIKSYIVEKLRPGEEDRALSQVISNALQPHNELSSTSEAESKPKVTESEEVKIRLGTDEDTNPVSQSYVEMLKGTVDSWLGRGGQTPQGSQESLQGKQAKSGCASGEAEDFSHDNNGHGTRGEN